MDPQVKDTPTRLTPNLDISSKSWVSQSQPHFHPVSYEFRVSHTPSDLIIQFIRTTHRTQKNTILNNYYFSRKGTNIKSDEGTHRMPPD